MTARRVVWVLGGIVVVIVVLLAVRLTQALAAKRAITNKGGIPAVSVTEAGRSEVPTTVSIIGTIDARYDTPIGVEGDGGRVLAIYVEAGDHVKRGQMLARIDTRCCSRRSRICRRRLDLARAEADLAAAEYQRAMAVGQVRRVVGRGDRAAPLELGDRGRQGQGRGGEARRSAGAARAPEVRAPADGIILTRTVEVGQTASPGGDLVSHGGRRRGRIARPVWLSRTCRC